MRIMRIMDEEDEDEDEDEGDEDVCVCVCVRVHAVDRSKRSLVRRSCLLYLCPPLFECEFALLLCSTHKECDFLL